MAAIPTIVARTVRTPPPPSSDRRPRASAGPGPGSPSCRPRGARSRARPPPRSPGAGVPVVGVGRGLVLDRRDRDEPRDELVDVRVPGAGEVRLQARVAPGLPEERRPERQDVVGAAEVVPGQARAGTEQGLGREHLGIEAEGLPEHRVLRAGDPADQIDHRAAPVRTDVGDLLAAVAGGLHRAAELGRHVVPAGRRAGLARALPPIRRVVPLQLEQLGGRNRGRHRREPVRAHVDHATVAVHGHDRPGARPAADRRGEVRVGAGSDLLRGG